MVTVCGEHESIKWNGVEIMMQKSYQIKYEAVAHYLRMIFWAMEQPSRNLPDSLYMDKELGEYWQGIDCAYCRYYEDIEADCPLVGRHACKDCCSGLWHRLCDTRNWREFISKARYVLDYIIENG